MGQFKNVNKVCAAMWRDGISVARVLEARLDQATIDALESDIVPPLTQDEIDAKRAAAKELLTEIGADPTAADTAIDAAMISVVKETPIK